MRVGEMAVATPRPERLWLRLGVAMLMVMMAQQGGSTSAAPEAQQVRHRPAAARRGGRAVGFLHPAHYEKEVQAHVGRRAVKRAAARFQKTPRPNETNAEPTELTTSRRAHLAAGNRSTSAQREREGPEVCLPTFQQQKKRKAGPLWNLEI
ncbi:hypothetical protein EYF80_056780 [Liparis tanakae]|uniref:Secreted protein n=1 Tax=Liparis tanakae TaxID=230148 RepID=A0A4Z2EXI3_9TELE|nr:hypothetical protein EYF80_056780 [Liparis tanakae]